MADWFFSSRFLRNRVDCRSRRRHGVLLVDAFSSVFYAAVCVVLGFSFHRHLEQVVGFLGKLGVIALVLLLVAVGAHLGCAILKCSSKRPPNLSQHHSLNVIS